MIGCDLWNIYGHSNTIDERSLVEGLIAKCMLGEGGTPTTTRTGKYTGLATSGPLYPRLEGGVVPDLDRVTALGREILRWPAQPSTVPPSDLHTPSGCLTLSPTETSKGPSVSHGTVVKTYPNRVA